jgi:ferredoxin
VKVVLDHDRCTGHGRCYSLAPDVFVDDDAGYGQVKGDGTIGDALVEEARRAVLACPERAIILED